MNNYPHNNWTLGQSKKWLRSEIRDKGATCPCCQQFAKVYVRRLHSGMTRALIHMYQHRDDDNKFDITVHLTTNKGDTSKLRYWGLIEHDPLDKEGVWKITALGRGFVRGVKRVPSHVELYNGQFLKLTGPEITIRQSLGNKFDYNELMQTPGTADPEL